MGSKNKPVNWHSISVEDVLKQLKTGKDGLSEEEAKKRLEQYGPNKIREQKLVSGWDILFRQLRGFFNIVLYVALAIAIWAAKVPDAVFIAAILVINTTLSFYQEYKASRAMEALKEFLVATVKVVRGGESREIEVDEVVPGDVLDLEEGEKAPADARLLEVHALRVDESTLTGESTPVDKEMKQAEEKADLGDRTDMVYAGTTIVRGTARAVVTATAMETELGKIAAALEETETPPTSFEIEVDSLSKHITIGILCLVVGVALLLYLRHAMPIADIAIFSLSLGVGAIPESLPVVLSFALAMGAQQMAHRKALARRLAIVESLGSIDVIGSDKTGTLTKNEMTVQALYLPGHGVFHVTGEGYDPNHGEIEHLHEGKQQALMRLLQAVTMCNNAKQTTKDGKETYLGDPTEIALLVVAEKGGHDIAETLSKYPRLDEIPFTSDRQMMTTIHEVDGKKMAILKGAPEVILERCTHVYEDGHTEPMTDKERNEIKSVLEDLEGDALRVLAVATHELSDGAADSADAIEKDIRFLGLTGMIDPPRPEVRNAIAEARGAGIGTLMITGDHAITAAAIAGRLGMGQKAVSGSDVEAMSDDELHDKVEEIDIVARATPMTKLRVLQALRANKHFAAMTGDGVNDSPALKQADVGVAMGLRGTDAAKEASGMILLDDNYATIVSAIEEGRRIFDNIRKFVNYLLTCNVGEVLMVMLGALWGLPPVTAIMVLWVNILTDVLPAIALGVDPANPGLMKRKPRPHDEPILNKPLLWTTIFIGVKKGFMLFLVFLAGYYWLGKNLPGSERIEYAQTMAFTGIILYSFVRIFVIRTFDTLTFWSNPWLVISLGVAVILQVFIIYCPEVHDFFGLQRLGFAAWGLLAGMAVTAGFLGVWISNWITTWAGSVIDTSGSA
ncbi:MAG: cation-translocating P-type ATPase [Planctomycetes bacterium]|nr:cation-translocating P-type ATPase [Planctomycetota bacterium]